MNKVVCNNKLIFLMCLVEFLEFILPFGYYHVCCAGKPILAIRLKLPIKSSILNLRKIIHINNVCILVFHIQWKSKELLIPTCVFYLKDIIFLIKHIHNQIYGTVLYYKK
jgi:hypothetical protein